MGNAFQRHGLHRARRHLAELLAENLEILETNSALAAACRERGIRPGPVGSA